MKIKITITAEYDYDLETDTCDAYYKTSRIIDTESIHRGDDTWFSNVIGGAQMEIDKESKIQGATLDGNWEDVE